VQKAGASTHSGCAAYIKKAIAQGISKRSFLCLPAWIAKHRFAIEHSRTAENLIKPKP